MSVSSDIHNFDFSYKLDELQLFEEADRKFSKQKKIRKAFEVCAK